MNKTFVTQLDRARRKGVEQGIYAMQLVTLLAADNVLQDYLDEASLKKALAEIEAELNRIWEETVQSSGGKQAGADDAAELLVGYVERKRREREMEGLFDD